ncbi:MAG: isopenicillin N synthase family oxygenase [Betaproteobacteria bacterium]|nr:isopenicillin N synthase family oxygenase [Betaproteobacteria bacterium]
MNDQTDISTAKLLKDIPLIDLAPVIAGESGAQERAGAQLLDACQRLAFFFVANHGVPPDAMDAIIAQSARFHGLPMAEKLKVKVGADVLGYLPPGGQTQASSIYNKNTRRELSASYYMRREAPDDAGDVNSSIYYKNKWPENLPEFRATLLDYYARLDGLARHLLPLFSIALGMGPKFFTEHPGFNPFTATLRLLEYPSQDPNEENLFGIGPHSDYGCITILHQGPTAGLELMLPEGEWIPAPSLPGHFLINTGQMLERWSNDKVPATPHRVINSSGHLRHSAAYLISTREETQLTCLPGCQGPDNPARYPPFSYGEHIANMRKQNYHLPK